MSVFGNIASAIFGHRSVAPGTATGSLAPGAPKSPGAAPGSPAPGSSAAPGSATGTSAPSAPKAPGSSTAPTSSTTAAAGQKEKYDWQRSIVDLMKLLNLDSSLHARQELAKELGYTGALDGSAEMNVWLHKQVMTKLAESGGKVPDSLKA
jgi:hypothetical protein